MRFLCWLFFFASAWMAALTSGRAPWLAVTFGVLGVCWAVCGIAYGMAPNGTPHVARTLAAKVGV